MQKNNKLKNFYIILFGAAIVRIIYFLFNIENKFLPSLGGDVCYHYNIAYNLASGKGFSVNFIYSYWNLFDQFPVFADLYLPGFYLISSIFLLFSKDYFFVQLFNLLISFLNIFLSYYLGKKLRNENLGIFCALIVAFNIFHIQHSIIFMTVNFSMLLIQLFLISLFSEKKNVLILGCILGFSSISVGGWQALVICCVIFLFLEKEIKNKNILFISLPFLFFYISWGIVTYLHLGEFRYSMLSLSIFSDAGWLDIINTIEKPKPIEFFNIINTEYFWAFFQNLIFNFKKFSEGTLPWLIYLPFNTLIFIIIIFFSFSNIEKKKLLILILLMVLLYFAYTLYLRKDFQYRYSIIFLPILSILIANSLINIFNIFFKKKISLSSKKVVFIVGFLILINCIQIKFYNPFENQNVKYFYEFGSKIQKITKKNDIIFYSFTPSDLWCATKRNIVNDIGTMTYNKKNLLRSYEIYKPKYVLFDLSDDIYPRHNLSLDMLKNLYKDFEMKLILKDELKKLYFFELTHPIK